MAVSAPVIFLINNISTMDFVQQVHHLYNLLEAGNPVEAMELYYHEEVAMQENEEKPRMGKAFCIQYEKGLMAQVEDFQARVLAQAINVEEEIVFTEMEIGFTRNAQRHLIREVSRQKWQDGQVISEKFYYKEVEVLG
ncbi:MAG: hypothetical protein SFV55_14090 [Haliscomenobacter sp.]|uniref:hypothetical protein n=1 Tax=Haliscomenobacter sp. TaxID=2717303 RepID=UPI0029B1F1AE|nr:hypothetical protein [Haliscomenobacter sp.]MDX2069554.1 hypothetical protein [Haliscomenobacter sp.]